MPRSVLHAAPLVQCSRGRAGPVRQQTQPRLPLIQSFQHPGQHSSAAVGKKKHSSFFKARILHGASSIAWVASGHAQASVNDKSPGRHRRLGRRCPTLESGRLPFSSRPRGWGSGLGGRGRRGCSGDARLRDHGSSGPCSSAARPRPAVGRSAYKALPACTLCLILAMALAGFRPAAAVQRGEWVCLDGLGWAGEATCARPGRVGAC